MFGKRLGLIYLTLVVFTIITAIEPATAHAYVGPSAGVSFLGAAVGVIAAFFSAIGVILFWPIRLLIRKVRAIKSAGSQAKSPVAASEFAMQPERKASHGTL